MSITSLLGTWSLIIYSVVKSVPRDKINVAGTKLVAEKEVIEVFKLVLDAYMNKIYCNY